LELAQAGDTLTKENKKLSAAKYKKIKWTIVFISLLINFGILAFIKYYNFFALNTMSIFSLFSGVYNVPILNLLLPLGISFYTFQSTGYVIDVFRGKIQPDKNIAKFALFVSFSPQIVQGPISRYDQLAHQLYEPHQFDYTRFKFGAQLVLWGLFKKMVIADRAAVIVDMVFNNFREYRGITILFAAMLYSVQVYCDFSGGIDIARGVSQILGITLTNNFERPFFATSITDFWRRWHITLSSWMRDYVFYPLSLSTPFTRLGKFSRKFLGKYLGRLFPTFIAMLITFLLVGIWHGASWKFVAYGLYNGVFIFSDICFAPIINWTINKLKINTKCYSWHLFQILATFFIVSIGRYFSRAPRFLDALRMLKRTFTTFNPWVTMDGTFYNLGLDIKDFNLLMICIIILILVDLFQEKGYSIRDKLAQQNLVFRWSVYLLAIFSILIFGMYGFEYKAIDFIYMGF
jgi:alginate O-acetyltransferase complex protein AlgI